MSHVFKLMYRFNIIPIKIQAGIFVDLHKLIVNLHGITKEFGQPKQFFKRTKFQDLNYLILRIVITLF